ncbi:hypothetical protein [Geothrix sp. 21YS21S-4]|uniref:hypothetical protein n=1 Tax=Geothrix sp. 21YS21S-4 TaxID=3068889 RepID=UPI0027BA1F11|nr:hypothetical protein [Geothrix sp. 21YS21S-4]
MLTEQLSNALYTLVDPSIVIGNNAKTLIEAILVVEDNQLTKDILNYLLEMHKKPFISVVEVNKLRAMLFFTSYPLFDTPRLIKLGFSLMASKIDTKAVMERLAEIGEVERRALPENVQNLLQEIGFIVEDASEGFGDIEIPATFAIDIIATF